MSNQSTKKVKLDTQPICPYGSKCYRKNPTHFTEYSHIDSSVTTQATTNSTNTLPICPFGATCYRKNLMHFAEYSHPFNLLNPDTDSSDDDNDEQRKKKDNKRKAESQVVVINDDDDGEKTEEYDSDDDSVYDVKLEKTFSQMTDDEKRLMIERAFELKDKLQEKLKKSREETEERKKEIEQLQSKISDGILLMEGEEEVLKGTKTKYFELFPERNYKQGSAAEVHFRLAESQFYRLLSGYATAKVSKVEYVCNPVIIAKFSKAREELKKKRGDDFACPILAFHGTAVTNIIPICENGFKVPGETGFKHATDTGFYGRGAYFSEYPGFSMGYIKGSTKLLLCQILQGKVYECTQMILGSDLKDGYDSHRSPSKQELIIFRSDYILPQYIVHYKISTGEFSYTAGISKEEIKKKLGKIGKLYKKAVKTKTKNIFNGRKFQFIGQMIDTPIAIEALVKRFGGHICQKTPPTTGLMYTTGLFSYGSLTMTTFDAPQTIICSFDEIESTTPSTELQSYKNLNYQQFYREDFLYDSIIAGIELPLEQYCYE